MDLILHERYKLTKRIGKGSYGEVWEGYDTINQIIVAIKIEDTTKNPKELQLRYEYNVYSLIGQLVGFPTTYGFTTVGNNNYMIMEPVGYSLEQLYSICSKNFSLKTVLRIADQAIERLQQLHSRYFIHRDIKPDNFAIGIGNENKNKLYLIDFGLAQRFVDRNNRILPMRNKCQPTGNARYASLNNHLGCEQSRRDDLEGVAYMLIYFLTGTLPWVNACSASKDPLQRMKIIGQIKLMTSISAICKDTPPEFETFLRSVRQLRYEEEPKYDEYRKMFRDLYQRECIRETTDFQPSEINTGNKGANNNSNSSINEIDNNPIADDFNHVNKIEEKKLINVETDNINYRKSMDLTLNRNECSDLNLNVYVNTESSLILTQANDKEKLSARSNQAQFPIRNQQNSSLLVQYDESDSSDYNHFNWDWELIEGYKPLLTLEKQEIPKISATKSISSLQKKKLVSPPILQPRIKVNPLMARKNSKFRSNYSKVTKRMSPFS